MKRVVALFVMTMVLSVGSALADAGTYLNKFVAPGQTFNLEMPLRINISTDPAFPTLIASSDSARTGFWIRNVSTNTGITVFIATSTNVGPNINVGSGNEFAKSGSFRLDCTTCNYIGPLGVAANSWNDAGLDPHMRYVGPWYAVGGSTAGSGTQSIGATVEVGRIKP